MLVSDRLLHWYDHNRRHLPWRAAPGQTANPYHVWLSEIMLQQTTVQTVIPYFLSFIQRWPTVQDLAAQKLDDVLLAWAGLGYYARARNLHKCAQVIAANGGVFPDSEDALQTLPGVGSYTAAAIAAIAYSKPAVVMDGNVERVMARLYAVTTPLPAAKPQLKQLASLNTPPHRPGDYAQAVMDLGASLCSPRSPACGLCPLSTDCQARLQGDPANFPYKTAKKAKPTRYGIAFWITDPQGQVLVRRRPESGLLGGMMEIPTTPWVEGKSWGLDQAILHAPTASHWQMMAQKVLHTFTHFHLELGVVKGFAEHNPALGLWYKPKDFGQLALPTTMKKIVKVALAPPSRN